MENTNWLRQTAEKPLFEDLIWSRPENKRQAGKLLIIGGNAHGFAAPVAAYNAAQTAGIGSARVILPESLRKTVGPAFTETDFAPHTPNGSFAKRALDMILDGAGWADSVLLAGDFGRNSETAVLLSSFMEKCAGHITVAQDSLDYFLDVNSPLMSRPETLAVINMGKLQKLGKTNHPQPPVRHAMNLMDLVKLLNGWRAEIITMHSEHYVASFGGKTSTTPVRDKQNWQAELAAYAAVWRLQNPKKPLEALTTAIYDYMISV
ncbi:MAG TPA: hypothetical protein VFW52_01295 [Candidatus Saccharimonadales bacterium]|nr:hypothetical protein [Candidatus Saccharimonadales bacterium]